LLAEWQNQLSQALLLPNCSSEQASGGEALTLNFPTSVDIEERRLALYQELMFNTLLEALQSVYPYTYQVLSQGSDDVAEWSVLAEAYRRAYPNQSHKLTGALEHFPRFLSEQSGLMEAYPFLSELAQYEWLEMQVLNAPDIELNEDAGQFLAGELPDLSQWSACAPVWNAAHVLHRFDFPIPEVLDCLHAQTDCEHADNTDAEHAIMALSQIQPNETDILIYRDPDTLQARFFRLNGMTSLLVQLSSAQPGVCYAEILRQLQELVPALQSFSPEALAAQAVRLFENCLNNKILLGSVACNE
jgi:hypothetical protein